MKRSDGKRRRAWWVAFALATTLAIGGVGVGASVAEAQTPPAERFRLTVRPHEMTLGQRTDSAGQFQLNARGDSVYIPQSAVGKRRVPLLLQFGGEMDRWRAMADKYGMILVLLSESWFDVRDNGIAPIDSLMQQVLSAYAIDPNKIAIMGLSNGGNLSILIGCSNLGVFSRLGLMSPIPNEYPACADTTRPPAARTQMYLSVATDEAEMVGAILAMAAQARRDGHRPRLALDLRPHANRRQDHENVWQWLTETWASPESAKSDAADPPDTVTALTDDAITKMVGFWKLLRERHPIDMMALANDWPVENRKPITVVIGSAPMTSFDMLDVQAIAAKDTAVAAALRRAGLTFQQEEAYRAAVIGAHTTLLARDAMPTLAMSPAVKQNVKFVQEHRKGANYLMGRFAAAAPCELDPEEAKGSPSC